MKKNKKIFIIYGVILLIALIISICLYFIMAPKNGKVFNGEKNRKIEIPKLKIIDTESNSRPIAVMINNHNLARPNHAGLQEAQVVYELIVEGGITRMMAIFKDKDIDRIGSVRSSRHNFLDFASEYDAVYVHFGWSKLAKNDISKYKINNINGLYDSGFFRDKTLKVPTEHTAFTSIKGIKETMKKRKYKEITDTKFPLNYSIWNINLSKYEDAIRATSVTVPYSDYMTSSYKYDEINGVYLRFANGKAHTDAITKKQYTFKNIIIMKVKNYKVDSYGRQNLDTKGSGEGYYITNGYARKITWKKDDRMAKTTYKYLDGEEVVLNDGNTFIQVEPINKTPIIKED